MVFLQNSRKVLFQAATLQRCPETVHHILLGISILSLFRNELDKFNNTGARMLDSIYHMTLRSLWNLIFGVKTLYIASLFLQRCYWRNNVSRKSINH